MTIVDILRRCDIHCTIYGTSKEVEGAHHIVLKSDAPISRDVLENDMVILPGGYGQADAMKNNEEVQSILKQMAKDNKYVCAMCASPIALEKAGLLENRRYTAYQGYNEKIKAGQYEKEAVVTDGHLVTAGGPACAYAFAYTLADLLILPGDRPGGANLANDPRVSELVRSFDAQNKYLGALVEVDQNLITSQGPASPYPFAFRIMELFGVDPAPFRHALMYDLAKGR